MRGVPDWGVRGAAGKERALAELVWGALGWMPAKAEVCWLEGTSCGS